MSHMSSSQWPTLRDLEFGLLKDPLITEKHGSLGSILLKIQRKKMKECFDSKSEYNLEGLNHESHFAPI